VQKLLAFIKHEFLEVLPPTIFFFLAFNIIWLTSALMLQQYGIDRWALTKATVGALVVGKVVLIADKLPFINQFPDKPLIYNVGWKTAIYVTAAMAFRYVEHVVAFINPQTGFFAANAHLWSEIVWPRFWAVQIWLVVLFLAYCAMRELVRVVGRDRVLHMFFGDPKTLSPGNPADGP
jgi:hypothetical protein